MGYIQLTNRLPGGATGMFSVQLARENITTNRARYSRSRALFVVRSITARGMSSIACRARSSQVAAYRCVLG